MHIIPEVSYDYTQPDGRLASCAGFDAADLPLSSIIYPHNSAFWWKTTGTVFARMLEEASYSPPLLHSYVNFYRTYVLPEFGPDPLSYILASSGSHRTASNGILSPSSEKHGYFRSYMTDDHSPVELSCIFGGEGSPIIRFAIDPIMRQENANTPAMKLFEKFASRISSSSTVDLEWCEICVEELTIAPDDCLDALSTIRYPSQYFIGFEFSKMKTDISMKAYFLPETVAAVMGLSKFDLITNVTRRLSCLDSRTPLNLFDLWNTTLSFFHSLPPQIAPSVEIIAVDCVPSDGNRLKVYVRTPRVTLSTIKRFMTLDSSDVSTTMSETLEQVSIFWRLLFADLGEDDEPRVEQQRLRHLTGGLMFYYELRGTYSRPFPKVYIPVRHLCNNDEEIVSAMERLYARVGNQDAMRRYRQFVEGVFTHRPLADHAGIHTYVSFASKPRGTEITAYYNPECFSYKSHVI